MLNQPIEIFLSIFTRLLPNANLIRHLHWINKEGNNWVMSCRKVRRDMHCDSIKRQAVQWKHPPQCSRFNAIAMHVSSHLSAWHDSITLVYWFNLEKFWVSDFYFRIFTLQNELGHQCNRWSKVCKYNLLIYQLFYSILFCNRSIPWKYYDRSTTIPPTSTYQFSNSICLK